MLDRSALSRVFSPFSMTHMSDSTYNIYTIKTCDISFNIITKLPQLGTRGGEKNPPILYYNYLIRM